MSPPMPHEIVRWATESISTLRGFIQFWRPSTVTSREIQGFIPGLSIKHSPSQTPVLHSCYSTNHSTFFHCRPTKRFPIPTPSLYPFSYPMIPHTCSMPKLPENIFISPCIQSASFTPHNFNPCTRYSLFILANPKVFHLCSRNPRSFLSSSHCLFSLH